jgi:hypothetical protein
VGKRLERLGYLKRDTGEGQDPRFTFPDDIEPGEDEATLQALQQAAITYRIALGPHAGRKAFTLQTLPPSTEVETPYLAKAHGFSLHAGVACNPAERDMLERLARYISRPALCEHRLSVTANGDLRYCMKTPWKNGTTHVVLSPLDFMSRLAALVPRPRAHLVRFHGLFAPNARERSLVTPAPALAAGRLTTTPTGDLRYKMKTPWRDGTTHVQFHPLDFISRLASLVPKPRVNLVRFHGLFAPHAKERSLVTPAGRRARQTEEERTYEQRRQAMTWAQRLMRVFAIDITQCHCGGKLRIIASIEDPTTIRRILDHFAARAPPQLPLIA